MIVVDKRSKKKNIGRVIHKAGEWYDNHSKCSPHDIIEGYETQQAYDMLKEREEYFRNENARLENQLQNIKKGNTEVTEEEEYLNLMIDIKRIDKAIRRLDKRMRKSKDDDVAVRCANAIGLLEGKKLVLIQAVTHVKRK